MLKYRRVINNLSNVPFFDTVTVQQLLGVSKKATYENINRWIKQGRLIQLKKGLYTTQEYYKTLNNKQVYLEFLANNLRVPSYLSLEYVLQKYSILTEQVFAYTSITLKTKRMYTNALGTFIYRQISLKLFAGFKQLNIDGFTIYQATKAKALFDYLYLKFLNYQVINTQNIIDLRLNLDQVTKTDLQELAKYCRLAQISKFKNLPNLIKLVQNANV